jgi:predicted SprT family Zn-dependent metalloprotease
LENARPFENPVDILTTMEDKVFHSKNEEEELEKVIHHELEHFVGNPSIGIAKLKGRVKIVKEELNLAIFF